MLFYLLDFVSSCFISSIILLNSSSFKLVIFNIKSLSKLFVLTEAYPDLKADKHYIKLQTSLEELENKIAFARQFYNDTILKYNLKIETVPSNIVAILFGFKKYNYFKIEDKERHNVNINLK